jgi:Fe-S cluster biogenesis protein NfuA
MREKVEAALSRIRSSLRGAEVVLIDVNDGVVTVELVVPFCVSGVPKDIAFEIIEEQLKELVPEVKEVIAI